LRQQGHRCTQCGEREWLTDDPTKLFAPRGRRKPTGAAISEGEVETVWATLAANPKRRAWAKQGEHLCAICTAKRLWPTLFAQEVGALVDARINRFVVSTHALAISTAVELNLDAPERSMEAETALKTLNTVLDALDLEPAVLPRRVMKPLHARPAMHNVAKRLPALLERMRDDVAADSVVEGTNIRVGKIARLVKQLFGDRRETYYALIQMDGDRMGAWLAGNEDTYKLHYRQTWHPQVGAKVDEFARQNKALSDYLNCPRPSSPARHAAISGALNDFSIHVVRHVIEECVKGKLLYAGGDDVLALVAVDDLLDAMQLLRLAYSGLAPHANMGLSRHVGELRSGGSERQRALLLKDGFGLLNQRLMTLMGHKATASMGAVVAHHQAPLGMVLRQLREAEKRAKGHARNDASGQLVDRDAFCLRILKRGGGEVSLTSPWWQIGEDKRPDLASNALRLCKDLRDELAQTSFSRGAIYRAQLWFAGLTDQRSDIGSERWRSQLAGSLAYQFDRQNRDVEGKRRVAQLAWDAVDFICDVMHPEHPRTALENLLVTAEFFARKSRVRRDDGAEQAIDSTSREASA